EALTSRLSAGKPVTLASFGDSISWPCFHTDFRQNYLTLTADALRNAYPASQITLVHGGNMGAAARGLTDDRFARHVLSHRPDLVFLMFGMNDCLGGQAELEAYDRSLTALIGQTRASGALPVVCTQNEILYAAADGKLRRALPHYMARALRVARREGAPAVDCFARWKGLATVPDLLINRLNDAIHPNLSGHRLFAQEIVGALWPDAVQFATDEIRSSSVDLADLQPCLLPGPAGKQVVRSADGTWLVLTARRQRERVVELVVSFTRTERPGWDDFRHVTVIGQGPNAVFDHTDRTLTAGALLERHGHVFIVLSWNVGIFFLSLDTTQREWAAVIDQPQTWLHHTKEPFLRPTAIVQGQQDGRVLYDALVIRGDRLAIVFKHFEMAPGAGWEVINGQEIIALATRSPNGDSRVQPLGQPVFPETPPWQSLGYWGAMDESADALAVLSERQGQIKFSLVPLAESSAVRAR
ncbi:MAG: SGNH/GDSL hydrolase family protein, partial [Planctomycetales bacterium]